MPSPGDLPHPGIEAVASVSPALAIGFFTTEPPEKSCHSKSINIDISLLTTVFTSFSLPEFLSNVPGLLQDPISDIIFHLVTMSPLAALGCDSLSDTPKSFK